VVIAFFEGNDLSDLRDEYTALAQYHETGHRQYRDFKTQTSMLKALFTVLQTLWSKKRPAAVNARFKSAHGDIPISVDYTPPPNKADLSAGTIEQLEYFFRQYAEFAKRKGIKAWLAYMPCKSRVVYGHVEFTQGATESQKKWKPSDLPQAILEISDRYGIDFIDLTAALVEETNRSGELLYNPISRHSLEFAGFSDCCQGIRASSFRAEWFSEPPWRFKAREHPGRRDRSPGPLAST
jgi:hypothetical protein